MTTRKRRRGVAGLVLAATVLAGCGGDRGADLQRQAEERGREELEQAERTARQKAAERAKQEIDKIERQARRELKRNGDRRIREASDRAKREVDRAAK